MRNIITRGYRYFHISSTVRSPSDLYLNPDKWIGLPSSKIFDLYQQRVIRMGKNYQKSQSELDALLSTCKETGAQPDIVRTLYKIQEKPNTNPDITAGRIEGFNPLQDGEFSNFDYKEYSSTAQDLIDQHRLIRHLNRVTAYELPLLAKFRKEYKPPSDKIDLTIKYTSFIGESHTGDKKIVFKADFDRFSENQKLTDLGKHKLKLLLGKRYDLLNNQIHFSIEKLQYPTQNLKFGLLLLKNIVTEVRKTENNELLKDLPIDIRMYANDISKQKKKMKVNTFPKEWLRPQDAPIQKKLLELELFKKLSL